MTSEEMYIDLLQAALTGTLYKDPPRDPWHGVVRNAESGAVCKLGDAANLVLEEGAYDEKIREGGLDWPLTAQTMIGTKRMNNIRNLMASLLGNHVPGDFIETGVWRGGACIFMRGLLKVWRYNDRRVFVCDSFEGLPPPTAAKDQGSFLHSLSPLAVSLDEVRENFARYDLLDDQVVFVKGWFRDTLPALVAGTLTCSDDTGAILLGKGQQLPKRFALIRLDGDMYESTMDALNALYPRLSHGGACIIDDYNSVKGCHDAVDEYRAAHLLTAPLNKIDECGVFFYKPLEGSATAGPFVELEIAP